MSYDSTERETQENYFSSENGEQAFHMEEVVHFPLIQHGIDVSMSYTSDIQHIDSNISREGSPNMYMDTEQQQLHEPVAQEDSDISMTPAVDYYARHGPLHAYGHSQTSSEEISNYHVSYDETSASASTDSACLNISRTQAGAFRWKFHNAEVDYMDFDGSVAEENLSESTDSVVPVETDIGPMPREREHLYGMTLFGGPNDHYLQSAGLASEPSAFEVPRPEHNLDEDDLQWGFRSLPEMRQTFLGEQVAQILKDCTQALDPAGIDSSNTTNGHLDISALSSHYQVNDTDPAVSINTFEKNVDNLLASRQITTPPTHLLFLANPRSEEVFSGVGYPPSFQLLSRQPIECHDANFPHGSTNIYPRISDDSPRLDPQPSQTSFTSAVESATTIQSNIIGLHCSILLSNGYRCNAHFKGKHAKSHLGRHTRLKHEGKDFVCENADCKKVYTRRSYRSKHYTRHHPELVR